MKRLFTLIVLLLLAAPCGCGSKKPEGAVPPAPDAAEAPKANSSGAKTTANQPETPSLPPPEITIESPGVPEGLEGPSDGETK